MNFSVHIDLPGSGYSDQPLDFAYRTTDNARVVIGQIRHLQLPSSYLYGHSMSGSVAIEVADELSDRMAGLIVSECNLDAGGGMFSKHTIRCPGKIRRGWRAF